MTSKSSFFSDAKSYEKNSNMQYQASIRLIDQYKFKGDEAVLDIGCGYGLLASQIANIVNKGSVIGVDYSNDMIDHAKEKHSYPNLKFFQGSAETLVFAENQFDLIISTFCFQWITDKLEVFKRIKKYIKNTGNIILIMPLINQELLTVRQQLIHDKVWANYFKQFKPKLENISANEYLELSKQAGLNLHLSTETETTYFESMDKLKDFLKNVTYELSAIPADLHEDFMSSYTKEYCKKYPIIKDGHYGLTFTYVKLTSFPVK